MNTTFKVLAGNVLLFAVYYISAHFTLSLGLPPIGGTPVWVPTGISLGVILVWGYRFLPAVFMGDFIIGAELVGLGDANSLLVSILFGAQAAGHAWLATWFLIKFKSWPDPLVDEFKITRFFALSAFALLIVTIIFGLCELALGVLAIDQLLSTLFMWWTGGVIGILLFTPLVLIIFARPRIHWDGRILSVALPLLLLFTLLIAGLFAARQTDQQTRADKFNESVEMAHEKIDDEIVKNKLLLYAMQSYFKNSLSVSSEQFMAYVRDLSNFQSSIKEVRWADYIADKDRESYEVQQGGEIVDLNNMRRQLPADKRDDYFVLKYSQPMNAWNNRNQVTMFDLCSEQQHLCHEMMTTKKAMIVSPAEEALKKSHFLFVMPVMEDESKAQGMAGHLYEYYSLFDVFTQSFEKKWIELIVTDVTNPDLPYVLFGSGVQHSSNTVIGNTSLTVTKEIELGGRLWQLRYQPTAEFFTVYSDWTLYWASTSALLILSLLSVLLLAMTGRMQRINHEVQIKTKEIKKKEDQFRRLVEGIKGEYLLYTHDINGVFTYVSPSIEQILGYKREEFLCHFSTFLTDAPQNTLIEEYTRKTIEGEQTPSYELEIFNKNGDRSTLKITESAIKDDVGKVIGVEGVAQDITESKYEHMQMEKLSLAVENSPNAVMITDRKGIIEYINPKFTDITEYSATEVVGQSPSFLKSGNTELVIYDDLWTTILSGGQWRGEMQNRKKSGGLYWALEHISPLLDEKGNITHFVSTQEDITRAKQINEEASYHASHDLLTGLINRREFEERLKRVVSSAKEDSSEHALCFMDLDQFKVINDTCGHVAGDELLRQVGDLLLSNVRQRDTLARLGGDEFVLLMEYCGIDQAYDACQKIISVLADFRFHWEEHIFTLGMSIGLAIIDQHAKDSHEVMGHVDGACYAAKDAGRNRIEVHTEDSERLQKRKGEVHWSSVINEALDHDQFELYVQAIIPLKGEPVATRYEVLIRLKMPDGSIISPSSFLPAAERYNLAVKIDRWLVGQAIKWMSNNLSSLAHIDNISLNLSGQSLGDEAVLGFIIQTLQYSDVPASKIKFEITETAAIANLRDATIFIRTLTDLGCHFALDDFGSGLSSFAYLKNLKVDSLKIDGMFVKDILDDPIDLEMVKSINDIGHVMGLETIAEFVINDQIADKLRDIGVDYAQGYAFSEPMPINRILEHGE